MIFCASSRAVSICFCCSARARAASSRSRFAPSIASSSAFSRASTAAVIFGNTSLPRMAKRVRKTTSVQNIRPPFGARRFTGWVDSSGATCWRSAKMIVFMTCLSVVQRMCVAADRGRARHDPRRRKALELALNQERDNDCEQRGSLDERREDDRARLNSPGHLRLTRHAVHCLSSEATDTNTGPDHGETRADSGAEHCPRPSVLARVTGRGGYSLQQRKDRMHCDSPFNERDMSCSRPHGRCPSTGPCHSCPNGLL